MYEVKRYYYNNYANCYILIIKQISNYTQESLLGFFQGSNLKQIEHHVQTTTSIHLLISVAFFHLLSISNISKVTLEALCTEGNGFGKNAFHRLHAERVVLALHIESFYISQQSQSQEYHDKKQDRDAIQLTIEQVPAYTLHTGYSCGQQL